MQVVQVQRSIVCNQLFMNYILFRWLKSWSSACVAAMVFFTYRLPNDKEGSFAVSGSDTMDEILNRMGVCDETEQLNFFASCASFRSSSLSLSFLFLLCMYRKLIRRFYLRRSPKRTTTTTNGGLKFKK